VIVDMSNLLTGRSSNPGRATSAASRNTTALNYGTAAVGRPDAPMRRVRDGLGHGQRRSMATELSERAAPRSADLETLFPGRYLSVTSFKRDGTGVATPVWFVSDGERLYALTDLHSAKVRRMRRNPRVLVASCRPDGRLRGAPVPARAEVLTAIPELDRVQRLLRERYRLSYRLVMLIYRLVHRLRGHSGLGDGAALAITVGGQTRGGPHRAEARNARSRRA
jgi:uncharacterized protein